MDPTMECHTIMACTDCLLLIANDDEPEDRPTLRADIERNWPSAKGWAICVDSGREDSEFSWGECECCGSRLGGARHAMVAFRDI